MTRQSEQTTGRRYSCGKTAKFAGGVVPNILSSSWGDIAGALRDINGDLYEEPQPGYLEDYTTPGRVGQQPLVKLSLPQTGNGKIDGFDVFQPGTVGQQSLIMPPLPQVGNGKIDSVKFGKDVLKYINPQD